MYFHVILHVAPLKPAVPRRPPVGAALGFPRHFARGPIEASGQRPPPRWRPDFHVILHVAPLKPSRLSEESRYLQEFPRHFARGPIEARG